jgi:magnesium transporter
MQQVLRMETSVVEAGVRVGELAVDPPVADVGERSTDVRRRLAGERHGTVAHVAVIDGDRLVGLVRATDLMAAADDVLVDDLLMPDPPIVNEHDTGDRAAWLVTERGESEAVVVDDDGRLVGIVPAPRMLALLVHEHAEDTARIGGFLHELDGARRASSEPTLRRFWHRLPWLLVGLVGAVLASVVVSEFEDQLRTVVALSFFVPAIVYLANAVGAQTQSIAVRGLSVGVGIRGIVWRELATGVLLGVVLGTAFLAPAYLLAHDWNVALAVGLSLAITCALANVTALGMPWLFARMGTDPAFGSGPVATVVQDLSSIIVYLLVATIVVPEL